MTEKYKLTTTQFVQTAMVTFINIDKSEYERLKRLDESVKNQIAYYENLFKNCDMEDYPTASSILIKLKSLYE